MYSFCYVYRHFVCARITDIMDPVNCCYYSMHVHTHYTYIYVAEDSLWQSKRAQHLYPYCIWLFSLGDIYYIYNNSPLISNPILTIVVYTNQLS